jgi:ABC-2 type transport system permease protein
VLVFSNVLHACVQFSIEIGLLCAVLLVAGSPILPWLPLVIMTSLLLAVFASGFALALSTLSVFFRDITHLWTIFVQVWFFLTPVVYSPRLVEDRASEWVRSVLELNPMSAFVTTFRDLLYDATWPSIGNTLKMLVSAALSISAGWFVFLKMGQRLPEEV